MPIDVEDRPKARAITLSWEGSSHPAKLIIQEQSVVRTYPLSTEDLLWLASDAARYAALKARHDAG